MLGRERQSLRKVTIEIGGLLARDPVDEIERDVVERGITKSMNGAPDVVRTGNALEHLEQPWCERLRPERDPGDAAFAQQRGQLRRDRLRVRLDGHLRARQEAPPVHAAERPAR